MVSTLVLVLVFPK